MQIVGSPVQVVIQAAKGGIVLFRAWLGYKISKNSKNGESAQDRLRWASTIQNIQTDMGLQRSSFPDLGLLGDSVFAYDLEEESELQTEHVDLWLKEYKKEKSSHIREIVYSSMLTEQEKEWMGYVPQYTTGVSYDNKGRYVEQIVMPNFFDMCGNYHD